MKFAATLLAATFALHATAAFAESWERLSDQVRRDPARSASRMLGAPGLFTAGMMSADQAFFYGRPAPAPHAQDLCTADVLVVQLDRAFRPTGFRTARSFQATGARRNGGGRLATRTCADFKDATSFFWAPDSRRAAQALDGVQDAVAAARTDGPLPFTLECGPQADGCAKDPRALLARMQDGAVVDASTTTPCASAEPCLVVQVHSGNADQGEMLRVVLEGAPALTRVRIEDTGSWIADNFTAR